MTNLLVLEHRSFVPSTSPVRGLARAQLEIRHSLHEEFIVVDLYIGQRRFDLGSRSHNALLLELGRQRIADRNAGVGQGEEGWIHMIDLSQRLGLLETHINVQIHRIRRQLVCAGVPGEIEIVERRRGCGELRLGVAQLEIARL